MKNRHTSPLPSDTIEEMYSKWARIFKYHESACAYISSKDLLMWRLRQLQDDTDLQQKYFKRIKYTILDLETCILEDDSDVAAYLKANSNYLIMGGDTLLNGINPLLLKTFCKHLVENNVSCIVFFSKNILSSALDDVWKDGNSALRQNYIIHPIYSIKDIAHFLIYLQEKWSIKLPADDLEKIVTFAGGDMGIAKQLVRLLRDGIEFTTAISDLSIQRRCKLIWNRFSAREQEVLQDIYITSRVSKSAKEKQSILDFLIKSRYINKTSNKFQLMNPIKVYIENFTNKRRTKFSISRGNLILNDVIIGNNFSKQEISAIYHLIKKRNTLVSREELASIVWKESSQDTFSDWSLDRLMYRIRRKFTRISVSSNTLRTVKGKGYILYD